MAGIACVGLVAGLLLLGMARSAGGTTGIDPLINVAVRITDSRIVVRPSRVRASQTVDIRVVNTGKRTHDFRIAGQKTRPLQRRDVDHIVLEFFDPGRYSYLCKLHCTAKMRGFIIVRPK